MNWDAFAAIGEIVGAVAVIATLFYFSIQIRSAKVVSRNQTFVQIFDGVSRHAADMASPELSRVILKGFLDFESLKGEERLQFDNMLSGFMNYIEATLSTVTDQMLGDNALDEWAWYVRIRFAPYVGFRDWWAIANRTWPENVVAFINDQIEVCEQNADFYKIKASTGSVSDA